MKQKPAFCRPTDGEAHEGLQKGPIGHGWLEARQSPSELSAAGAKCAVSFSIGSSGGGTSLWLEFEPTDFGAMARAMMRANPDAAREAFRVAQEALEP